MSLTFGRRALSFYKTIDLPKNLPRGIEIIYPYSEKKVLQYTKEFFDLFYKDSKKRVFVFGINPGRFGSGTTGISFTDPVALERFCNIKNTLEKRRELSSEFIYRFVEGWCGAQRFYDNFFITAVSPIGFLRNGKNYNYYDDSKLFLNLRPFILKSIEDQLKFGARRDVAIVLGSGKNKEIFLNLNNQFGFFKKIYSIEHPRYIMQYQRKNIKNYIKKYQEVFSQAVGANLD